MENKPNNNYIGGSSFYDKPGSLLPFLITGLMLASLLSACSYPSIKSRDSLASEPFGGTVVDKETGKPIANAVVMMRWPRIRGGYTGSNTVGAIEVAESVTDAEGQYFIEGWFKGKDEIFEVGFIYKMNPVLTVFALGYWPTNMRNIGFAILPLGESWKADWDGKEIELKPVRTEDWNDEQWRKYFITTNAYLSLDDMPECAWLKTPNYYLVKHRLQVLEYKMSQLSSEQKISDRKPISSDRNELVNNGDKKVRTDLNNIFSNEKKCAVDPKYFFLSHGMMRDEFDECCIDMDYKKQ